MKTSISGVILFDETLRQTSSNGFYSRIDKKERIYTGIKVDKGAKLLAGSKKKKLQKV